jgi:hypothetical protein
LKKFARLCKWPAHRLLLVLWKANKKKHNSLFFVGSLLFCYWIKLYLHTFTSSLIGSLVDNRSSVDIVVEHYAANFNFRCKLFHWRDSIEHVDKFRLREFLKFLINFIAGKRSKISHVDRGFISRSRSGVWVIPAFKALFIIEVWLTTLMCKLS